MKKTLSIIVSVALLISLVIIPSNAAAEDNMTERLSQYLERLDDNSRVHICAEFNRPSNMREEVYAETERVCGELDSSGETYDWYAVENATRIRVLKEYLNNFLSEHGLSFADVCTTWKWNDYLFYNTGMQDNYFLRVELYATKRQIYRLAEIGDLDKPLDYYIFYPREKIEKYLPHEVPEDIEGGKIPEAFYSELTEMSDTDLVYCFVDTNPDYTDINELQRQAAEICGYDFGMAQNQEEFFHYYQVYSEVLEEDTARAINAMKQKLDDTIGRKLYVDDGQPIISPKYLTAEEVLKIAQLDDVYLLYKAPTTEFVPDEPYCGEGDETQPPATPAAQLGDANSDGKTDVNDVTCIQKIVALFDGYGYVTSADLDGDGRITIIDATRLQRKLANPDNAA